MGDRRGDRSAPKPGSETGVKTMLIDHNFYTPACLVLLLFNGTTQPLPAAARMAAHSARTSSCWAPCWAPPMMPSACPCACP